MSTCRPRVAICTHGLTPQAACAWTRECFFDQDAGNAKAFVRIGSRTSLFRRFPAIEHRAHPELLIVTRSAGAPSHPPSNMSRFADIGVELAVTGYRLMSEDGLKHKSLEFVDTSSIKRQLPQAFSSVRRRLSQSPRRAMPL